MAIILFVIWVNFLMAAWTNAVNLSDGLDGLCAGSSMIAFVGYAIIAMWQMYHLKGQAHSGFTYAVSDPLDLGIIACCAAVACLGFLWYNCNPASIFMGDTGSLALGGLFAALSIITHTEFLAMIIGGLFVVETLSDVIRWAISRRRTSEYSKWRRSTIISNCAAGARARWSCASGSSSSCSSLPGSSSSTALGGAVGALASLIASLRRSGRCGRNTAAV